MTLQYRLRDMSADRRWQQCVTLAERLVVESLDLWCRGDEDFPKLTTVAAILYLFSSRCDPFRFPLQNVRQTVAAHVGSVSAEYHLNCPNGLAEQGTALVASLCEVLDSAISQWNQGSVVSPTAEAVVQKVVDLLIEHQYVIFYHHQTTRRDFGGFHSHG